jgi:hypothetical protein
MLRLSRFVAVAGSALASEGGGVATEVMDVASVVVAAGADAGAGDAVTSSAGDGVFLAAGVVVVGASCDVGEGVMTTGSSPILATPQLVVSRAKRKSIAAKKRVGM